MIISKMLTKKDLDDKVTSMSSLSHGHRLITELFKYDNLNRPIECVSINHHDNDNKSDFKDKFGVVYEVEKVDNKYHETTIFKYDEK